MNRQEIKKSISSKFLILDKNGVETPVSLKNLSSLDFSKNRSLEALVRAEFEKGSVKDELPSIRAMQELELVGYEPASDKGHFRFYPKGALMFDLLRLWAEEIAIDRLGAYAIETPLIYDWDEPDIRNQSESFHENHYTVHLPDKPEKKFILRFAGDFGLFRLMKDAQLTYKHLPVRLYEFAPSFRYESSGNLSGLKRLRGFWMPDIHSFCTDLKEGIAEYKEIYYRYTELVNEMNVQYAVAFRVVEEFYLQNKQEILEMISYSDSPVLIETLSKMKHYWVMKHEINTVDNLGGVCQTSTVQLDVKDASLYGITYTDSSGKEKGCTIVHSSIGSPERWIFSILEEALKKETPTLPLWLSPTQVRIIPVSEEKHLNFCLEIAEKLKKQKIRVDIDDRKESLGKRIRYSEREWIPYVVVCGDKELGSSCFPIRVRGEEQKEMLLSVLAELIKEKTKGMPFRSSQGLLLSKKPVFRGRD